MKTFLLNMKMKSDQERGRDRGKKKELLFSGKHGIVECRIRGVDESNSEH
jgi:hypothetical protein